MVVKTQELFKKGEVNMYGKVLAKTDLQSKEYVTNLFANEKFKNLVSKMNEQVSFEPESLQVQKAYTFEAVVGQEGQGAKYFKATIVNLVNAEETINILYNEIPIHEDYLFGQFIEKADKNTLYKYEVLADGNVEVEQVETDVEVFTFNDEEIIIDDTTNDINAKAWWTGDGCLPGGYQHCGGDCGYNKVHGGGSPINSTDSCCIGHDRCWNVFGSGDKCCDKELVSCVKGHDTWAAAGIRSYFGPRGLLC